MTKMFLILFLLIAIPSFAQDDYSKMTIRTTQAAPGVYMMDCLDGFAGGNVAVSHGSNGVLIVDNMFAPMMPKLKGAIKELGDKPIRFAINTHFHRDHIDGNSTLAGTTIIAHENLRKRLESNNAAPASLPALTFTNRSSIYFNGEEIKLTHFPNGHTDTDVVVYFTKSKVVHLGDMFFFGMFPAVYTQGGGNIRQLIVNLEAVVAEVDPGSKVIPGHGELATVNDLKAYIDMLKETVSIVDAGIKAGKTLETLTKEKAIAKYEKLGSGGAQTTDQYLAMLFKLLGAK